MSDRHENGSDLVTDDEAHAVLTIMFAGQVGEAVTALRAYVDLKVAEALKAQTRAKDCLRFEPHPWPLYAEEYCVAPVYRLTSNGELRPQYCGRPRKDHDE